MYEKMSKFRSDLLEQLTYNTDYTEVVLRLGGSSVKFCDLKLSEYEEDSDLTKCEVTITWKTMDKLKCLSRSASKDYKRANTLLEMICVLLCGITTLLIGMFTDLGSILVVACGVVPYFLLSWLINLGSVRLIGVFDTISDFDNSETLPWKHVFCLIGEYKDVDLGGSTVASEMYRIAILMEITNQVMIDFISEDRHKAVRKYQYR